MKEEDIRKREAFNKYLELTREDIRNFFNEKHSFVSFNCPACESSRLTFEFEKHGFKYVSCGSCSTLFVNPRPSFNNLKNFYTDSSSAHYWVNEFFKSVAEFRRENIFRPRAKYVFNSLPEEANGLVGDIGAGFGIFLEELAKFWRTAKLVAIEPSPDQAEICSRKGLDVKCCSLEEVKGYEGQFDLLTAFELFERLFDPYTFLNHVLQLLKPGGFFLITTLNIQGFDLQLLWEESKSINPPHHLNFFNPQSISLLLGRCGFEVMDISTPGRLDWDIVEGMIENENMECGRFWNLLAKEGSDKCKREFQEWISRNNLSSHMSILMRKSRS